MKPIVLLFLIATGSFVGVRFLVQPVASQLAYDPTEYCEEMGQYYPDAGAVIEAIAAQKSSVTGYDFAYVCNVNDVPLDQFKKMSRTQRIGITRGNVSQLSPEIAAFSDLIRLQIHDQKLQSVPSSIGQLNKLEILMLGGNNLQSLPKEIGNLTGLRVLHAYDNALTSVPEEIGNLTMLEELDLHTNSIKRLPKSMYKLAKTLRVLYLGGNPISDDEKRYIKSSLPTTEVFF